MRTSAETRSLAEELKRDESRTLAEMKQELRQRRSEDFGRDKSNTLVETKRGLWQRQSKDFVTAKMM